MAMVNMKYVAADALREMLRNQVLHTCSGRAL